MKSSIRAALAVGALALASSQASASSIVYVDNSFNSGEIYSSTVLLTSNEFINDSYTFVASSTMGTLVTTLGFIISGGPVSVKDLEVEWFKDSVSQGTLQITDNAGIWFNPGSFNVNMLASSSYEFLLTGQANSGGGIYNFSVSPVPLPAAAWLFGSALLGLGALRRKQKAGNSEMAVA